MEVKDLKLFKNEKIVNLQSILFVSTYQGLFPLPPLNVQQNGKGYLVPMWLRFVILSRSQSILMLILVWV